MTRNKKDAIIAIISILFKFERQNLGMPVHIKKEKKKEKKKIRSKWITGGDQIKKKKRPQKRE